MARLNLSFALALALLLAPACAALRDNLQRAEDSYEQARYDDALVWLDSLEDDAVDMETDMRARFYYLRGMTAYRLDQRNDALHYLALAREVAGDDARMLRPEWRESLERTLAELTPTEGTFRARTAADAAGRGDTATSGGESTEGG